MTIRKLPFQLTLTDLMSDQKGSDLFAQQQIISFHDTKGIYIISKINSVVASVCHQQLQW